MNKSIILLSGGLDSLVALGHCINSYNIDLALTFDYGQKSLEQELEASKKIAEFYNINHKVVKLDWLKEITKTSLVADTEVPTENLGTIESAKNVWVPNRNGLFLNIAACFADSFNYKFILYGANKDEGATFPDNTEEFRTQISSVFRTSTLVSPQVIAPLINYTKNDIVRLAIDEEIPLELVRSCYNFSEKHCGKCESCLHLKNALLANSCSDLVEKLFE